MRILFSKLTVILLVLVTSVLLIYFYINDVQKARLKVFNEQVGTYKLDLQRTKLENYQKDSSAYKKLTITFYSDSTFKLNIPVPFINDTKGRWVADAGDYDSWNWLQFDRYLKKHKMEINSGNQFSHIQNYGSSSGFYINAVRPMDNQNYIQEVYFIRKNKK
ncbi:hypothetical protein [Flavobacterium reichenbachii]|uniref:Uncharacterized protein n=1 Tax=Flavobacterium reichenbachii TaxID=362418 RepID=A0A085ZHZ5_9FLAO|nr:hypothetical protein [Flavobacterium reichenbachii]KFF04059.1 hypothetical protein IW19_00260 [Flavobacterium reichenbachii]OXB12889.1 hypothetical protein B0A68_17150 [Flavobacterium reichenbachii]